MLDTKEFGEVLQTSGYKFCSGVPCSFLKYFINYSINNLEYIGAANEGDAVAICAGAYLGGRKAIVLMQNSGLTNALSPLTSLNYVFRIPVLGFVSLRGEPGLSDEPQHELLGTITASLLNECKIKHEMLSHDIQEAKLQVKRADEYMAKEKQPFFFIVKKNTFSEEKLNKSLEFKKCKKELINFDNPSVYFREETLKVISSFKGSDTVLLANTGKAGRELYEIEDIPNNFYMVGSMGCMSSVGLGIALAKPDKKIIVLDGDGGLLMRMGSLATNAAYSPDNMLHILLDNSAHDSTGGQSTVSKNVDFTQIASSSGYTRSIAINNLEELRVQIKKMER